MSGTAQDVISAARSQLGETDGAKYFAAFDTADLGPWCVAFVRWCMKQAGVDFPWSAWYAWDWRDAPRPIAPHDLQAGDAVSFDWDEDGGGDHVGIVKSVHDWGIVTIEGNTSGGIVAERQRLWSVVICGIRPTYSATGGEWRKSGERWWWAYPDGSWPASEWKQINDAWYYFDANGWMVTGWVHWGDSWYWCDKTEGADEGKMLSSTCIHDGTSWYALGSDGAMLTDIKTEQAHDGRFGAMLL